ncbi:MAG: FliH/SctL family protein [Betaproteobacteria bacterium]
MTNTSDAKAAKAASLHARFIPREELRSFAAWTPGAFGPPASAAAGAPQGATPNVEPEPRAALQAARQSGYQDGYRDGLVALDSFKQSYAAQTTAQVGALLRGFEQQFAALEQQMAQALAQAATALARQVVRSELATRPELVAAVAREALGVLLQSARHITVQVHPDDLALVAQGAADDLERRGARLVADPAVARGGCVVESDIGGVDAGIEQRWARAARALGDAAPLGEPLTPTLSPEGRGSQTGQGEGSA